MFSSQSMCETQECREFEIHLNNNFDDDQVRVEVGERVVFNERVTTDYILSLAEIIRLERPGDTHRLKVVVNGNYKGKKTCELNRERFIQVRFYREAIPEHNIPRGVIIDVSKHHEKSSNSYPEFTLNSYNQVRFDSEYVMFSIWIPLPTFAHRWNQRVKIF